MGKTNEEMREEITNIMLTTRGHQIGTDAYRSAYRRISELEEQIAAITSTRDQDGELSRWGAVAAAVLAGEPERARALAERFMAEPISLVAHHGISYLVGDALFPPRGLSAHIVSQLESTPAPGVS